MLCQIHWRFILYFLVWPFPLAGYVDPRRSREQQNRVASRYWHDCTHSPCCVDRFFGLKLFLLMGSLEAFVLDDDIRAALLLWARKTKLANMSLERLLALFKASCDEDHPMVERLAAASYLTQWLVNHHAAGGVDPRKTQARSELIRRGAPLAAANSKLAKRKARRGKKRSYFSGAQTFVWKHGLKIKLSRRARFAERSRLLNVFGTMSAEEKLRYQREELEAWEASIPHVADPDDKYQHVIGDKLFGLSSREFALREDVCVNGIREVTPEPTKQGMRNYEPKLREWSRQRLVVSDEGKAIPKTLRVTDTLPCGLAHPGLCPVKTAAYFEKGISVTQAMIKTVTDNMKVGDMFKLVATPDIGFFFGVVGYIRLRDPATVCVLKMVMSDDGRLSIEFKEGIVSALVASEVAAELFKLNAGLTSVKLHMLKTAFVNDFLHQFRVLETAEDGIELLGPVVGVPRPAPAGPVAADIAGGHDLERILAGFRKLDIKTGASSKATVVPVHKIKKVDLNEDDDGSSVGRDDGSASDFSSGDEPVPKKHAGTASSSGGKKVVADTSSTSSGVAASSSGVAPVGSGGAGGSGGAADRPPLPPPPVPPAPDHGGEDGGGGGGVEEGMAAVAEGMAAVVEGMAAAMVKGMAAVAEGMVEMLVVAMVEGMAAVVEGKVETLVVAMVEEGMAAVLWPKRRPRRKPVRGVARRGARSSSQESILQARRLDGGQFAPST